MSSTTEVAYIGVSNANKEVVWLSHLVGDLGIHQVLVLHCDSQSAIMLAKNPMFLAKKKHIVVKYHFSQEVLEDKHKELVKVHTMENLVDLFTKGLLGESFVHCHELMGIG